MFVRVCLAASFDRQFARTPVGVRVIKCVAVWNVAECCHSNSKLLRPPSAATTYTPICLQHRPSSASDVPKLFEEA